MNRPKYDHVKEHEIIGIYPGAPSVEVGALKGFPDAPKFFRPIERRENFKMFFQDKTPYWQPTCGWLFCDVHPFRPRQQPDNFANRQPLDGGPAIDYKATGNTIKGWFDLDYQWEDTAGGSTVKPGLIKVPDINKWEEFISMPNLDDLDWNGVEKDNKVYLDHDKAIQLGIQFGMWERLMNIMGVSDAAMALIDEDQQDGVHRFFDRLADLYVDYIQRMYNIVRIDSVFFHDDWGTHTGPFFSLDTCLEMIVPYTKRVIDACHKLDIIVEHHCCGKADLLVPAMIEEGSDFWLPQPSLHDLDAMIEKYNGSYTFALGSPLLTADMSEEHVRKMAKEWFEKYKDKKVLLTANIDPNDEMDFMNFLIFDDAVYELSRLYYQDAE